VRITGLTIIVATLTLAGCMSPPTRSETETAAPESMRYIELESPTPSPAKQLHDALEECAVLRAGAETLKAENESRRIEIKSLTERLAEADRGMEELQARVTRDESREQELMDALIACELEKLTFERRLLEIRLAEIQTAEEVVGR
jgi:chromosome segregation ATPase